jgi:hypothetical protein
VTLRIWRTCCGWVGCRTRGSRRRKQGNCGRTTPKTPPPRPSQIAHHTRGHRPRATRISRITVEQRLHRIVQQSPQEGVPQPQPLDQPARSSCCDRRLQARAQSSTPPFGPGLLDPGRVRCPMQAHPRPRDLRHQLNPKQNNPALKPGGLSIGDSPLADSWLRLTDRISLQKD